MNMGIYRHYKGPLYLVLGLAHDANDAERKCVVYIPLQTDGAHTGPRMAVRTYEDFFSFVEDEPSVLRFTYAGPELTEEMLNDDRSR